MTRSDWIRLLPLDVKLARGGVLRPPHNKNGRLLGVDVNGIKVASRHNKFMAMDTDTVYRGGMRQEWMQCGEKMECEMRDVRCETVMM